MKGSWTDPWKNPEMTSNFGASSGVVYVKNQNVPKLLVVGGKRNSLGLSCNYNTAQISPALNNYDGKWSTDYDSSDIPRRVFHCQVLACVSIKKMIFSIFAIMVHILIRLEGMYLVDKNLEVCVLLEENRKQFGDS